ncbi:MAG: hypothetical protein CME66_03625 [Halobacteriovoraceae bacterium]|nr:hypothetical protein [Halobacteriovoraceae bacterium]
MLKNKTFSTFFILGINIIFIFCLGFFALFINKLDNLTNLLLISISFIAIFFLFKVNHATTKRIK